LLSPEGSQSIISAVSPVPHVESDFRYMLIGASDAYTYLGLNSGNQYNIKVSLYSSADLLKPKDQQSKEGKREGFFYRKKKDGDDWRSVEWE